MKRRICVRSMVLGAAIMLIGMWVSPLISPPVTAQHNGVFDKIQCREIEVIDKDGNEAIRLYTTKHGGDIRMDSKDGRIATMGIAETGGSVYLSGKGKGLDGGIVSMHTGEDHASLDVKDRLLSDGGIRMYAHDSGGRLDVKGKGLFDGGTVYIGIAHKVEALRCLARAESQRWAPMNTVDALMCLTGTSNSTTKPL